MTSYKGYEITKTWQGYEVSKLMNEKTGRHWFLEKVINGEPKWCGDYLYSRKYKTESGAKKAIDRFSEVRVKEVKR